MSGVMTNEQWSAVRPRLDAAWRALNEGRLDEAGFLFRSCRAEVARREGYSPRWGVTTLGMACVAHERDHDTSAKRLARTALTVFGTHGLEGMEAPAEDALFLLGVIEKSQGRYAEAAECFAKASWVARSSEQTAAGSAVDDTELGLLLLTRLRRPTQAAAAFRRVWDSGLHTSLPGRLRREFYEKYSRALIAAERYEAAWDLGITLVRSDWSDYGWRPIMEVIAALEREGVDEARLVESWMAVERAYEAGTIGATSRFPFPGRPLRVLRCLASATAAAPTDA